MKFGGYQGPDSIHTAAGRLFGSELTSREDLSIEFDFEESIIARGLNSGELPGMVASGELNLCYMSTVRFSKDVPELAVFELPFLIKDRVSLFEALEGALGDYFKARIEEATPFKILGFWDNGFRNISNKVRPIRTPADCKGIAIRTQISDLHGEVFRAFGFEPSPIDIKTFLETIETDRVQAQDNPLTSIYIFDIHKHHHYITLSSHFFGVSLFICNRQVFESWPAEVQESVIQAAGKATTLQRKMATEQDELVLSKLEAEGNEVITLNSDERSAFEKSVAPLVESYRSKFGAELFSLLDS
ncbi:MAG: TRAP transporter substrate-binding protein [Nitrospinaceae bacterium]|nr:TRAP transporter substrate-binding protein [Nitrospinaceae bacterium]